MDLSSLFSDDQLAVMGCFLALAVCGAIAALSFRFGPANKPAAADSLQFRRQTNASRADAASRKAA